MKNIILLIVTFGLPIFLIFGSDTLDDGIKLALWVSYIVSVRKHVYFRYFVCYQHFTSMNVDNFF